MPIVARNSGGVPGDVQGECDVCGKEGPVYVASSSLGAISFGYCGECLGSGREPYGVAVGVFIGMKDMSEVGEWFRPILKDMLVKEGKTEEEFFKECVAFADEYEASCQDD